MKQIKGFTNYLRIEKGRSPSTIKAYLKDIERFQNWLDKNPENGIPLNWQEVKRQTIRAYLTDLDPSPSYYHRIIASLKTWFDYQCNILESRVDNPTQGINKPKKANHHPNALSLRETRSLIQTAVKESRNGERLRNWTLITFLVNTGLRISELCNMNESNIKYKEGNPYSITIIGKGNKERSIILSENAKTALHQWMRHRKQLLLDLPPHSDTQAIWIIPTGRQKGKRLSPAAVRKVMKKLGNTAGIQQNVHPHLLRHTFATEAVRGGAKLHALRDALGHSRLDTTGIYLHADEQELKAVASVLPDVLNNNQEQNEKLERDALIKILNV